MVAIRIRGLRKYFGPRLEIDGPERPREAFRMLLNMAGFNLKPVTELENVQRTVAVSGHVLQGIDLDIEQGSVVCLTGPTGSGKSVLLQILAGIIPPTGGRIEIHGAVRPLVSLGSNLDERRSAADNIRDSPECAGSSAPEVDRYVDDVITFAGLRGFEDAPLRTYSTGMTMRLSVALALCGRPAIVLIDDVLAVGDIAFQEQCIDRVHDLKAEGCTVVAAFSDDALIQQVATRVITLGGGRIVADEPPLQWLRAADAASSADLSWQVQRNLPEDDVMALRSLTPDPVEEGTALHLTAAFEAKAADLHCRPFVSLARGKSVIFRSLFPRFLPVTEPGPIVFSVVVPTSGLPAADYALGVHMVTRQGNNVYTMKADDAVVLTVRRDEPAAEADAPPLLTMPMTWHVEAMT